MNKKGRYFTCLYYPTIVNDFSSDDLVLILNTMHLDCIISPLHSPSDDKKKHYHVMIIWPNTTTLNSVTKLFSNFNEFVFGPEYVSIVHNPKNMIEYFIHANDPQKEQFTYNDLLIVGNPDLSKVFSPASNLSALVKIIDAYNLKTFSQVVRFLIDTNESSLLSFVISNNALVYRFVISDYHSGTTTT